MNLKSESSRKHRKRREKLNAGQCCIARRPVSRNNNKVTLPARALPVRAPTRAENSPPFQLVPRRQLPLPAILHIHGRPEIPAAIPPPRGNPPCRPESGHFSRRTTQSP